MTPDEQARTLRRLTPDDFGASMALGLEAFGALPPGTPPPSPDRVFADGRSSWGVFDGDRLVARTVGLRRRSWWGGRELGTCAVAGVTVAAEHRGEGLLAGLFTAMLDEARARGDVLSTLYPSASGIYRRTGYELIGSLDLVELRTADAAAVRPPAGVRTRRATVDDMPAVRALYDTWAAAQNGPLSRRGATFPATDQELLDDATAVTLAVDPDGAPVGYATWNRGTGYDESAGIEIEDLIALTADGYRALWRMLGSFAPVAPRLRLWTSGDDPARLVLPSAVWAPVERRAYMLRVLDVAGALAVSPGGTPAELTVDVVGDPVAGLDGGYRLLRDHTGFTVERVPSGAGRPTLSPNGLALLWTGTQNAANLRWAGLLTGPDDADALLDGLAVRGPRHIRDYF